MSSNFNPNEHLITLKGRDYLEVRWRLVWLRTEHPDASIRTEMLRYDDQEAVFRAEVAIPGQGSATGHGTETPADFGDYCEKAETKALGRALGALGYGTQFTDEFDMGDGETQKLVDSPVQRPARQATPPARAPASPRPAASPQPTVCPIHGEPFQASTKANGSPYHRKPGGGYCNLWDVIGGRKL